MLQKKKTCPALTFYDLPWFAREKIIRYAIVMDKIYPWCDNSQPSLKTSGRSSRKYVPSPFVNLLLTSKAVSAECHRLYYSENIFVNDTGHAWDAFLDDSSRALIRRAELHFSDADGPASAKDFYWEDQEFWWNGETMRLKAIHDRATQELESKVWHAKADAIASLSLLHLRINLRSAFCPPYCHRMAIEAVQQLVFDVDPGIPHEVDIVGLLDEDEARAVQSVIEYVNPMVDWDEIDVTLDFVDPPSPSSAETQFLSGPSADQKPSLFEVTIHWLNPFSKIKPPIVLPMRDI